MINHRIERLMNGKYRLESIGMGLWAVFSTYNEAKDEANRRIASVGGIITTL